MKQLRNFLVTVSFFVARYFAGLFAYVFRHQLNMGAPGKYEA